MQTKILINVNREEMKKQNKQTFQVEGHKKADTVFAC